MTIFHSQHPKISIPEVDVYSFLFKSPDFAKKASQKALIYDSPNGHISYTYGIMKERIDKFAAGLTKLGFKRGDVMGVFCQNNVDYPTILFSVLKLGGIISPANPTYTPKELAYQLQNAGCKYLVTQTDFIGNAVSASESAGLAKSNIFLISPQGAQGFKGLDQIFSDEVSPHVVLAGDAAKKTVAYLCYSSGTTGVAKGVMTSHYNMVADVSQVMACEQDYRIGDVWMGFLPFYHIYALTWIVHGSIAKGIAVIVMPKFDLVQFLEAVQKYSVSHVHCAPPVAIQMAKNPIVSSYNVSSIRMLICGAAPLGGDVAQELYEKTHIPIKQAYGMTESSPVSHISPDTGIIVASCGKLIPNMSAKIVSVDGREELGVDEEGELWMKGPNIMLGYHNNQEATRNTITPDGWLMTGDIAKVDASGNFYITDRLKELIKVKGFQVAPAELEALLLTHPKVADVAVIGIHDDYSDEVPKAFIVPKPNISLVPSEIISFMEGKVAPHKRLKGGVEFIAAIPRNPSGKILRKDLRALEAMKKGAKL
ncbi:hypothetical protein SmJEL517_g06029 [Synchytrium microbalum]|uniref:4-coumarate--CoA ligase n=1 Tax=Synchytrium microbalum TaxID=1806994 RepID=A0A507BTL4_9FUNG|nr:uncharacterized protein SmJEL517_g06029 [Synchytrium microbalum]TPX30419.1 hypothetical protein SmJEL517_g06029 [Synchytrium microbalum]